MIRDLAREDATLLPAYDVCVVGSGPAGGTLARELAGQGLRVCVLESGARTRSRHGDLLRAVESEGIHVKDYSRERVLGGASTTWAGLSSPLDAIDLAPRPWLAHSGWPLERAELEALWEEAAARYRFPPLASFDPAAGLGGLRARGELQPRWERVQEKVFLACVEPQDFGREQRAVYEPDCAAGGVDLFLDATVLRLATRDGRADHARVRTRAGRELRLEARAFVLAAGGLENARLLLLSRDACPAGLGNERDQVGRYLMNHPKNYRGVLRLARPVRGLPYYFGCIHGDWAGYAGLRLCEDVQRSEGLLNSYVRLEPLFPWSDSRGVEALVLLAKRSQRLLRAWRQRRSGEVIELRDYAETGDDSDLQNERKSALDWAALTVGIALDAPRVARYVFHRLRRRGAPPVRRVRLRNFMEMEPDPANRVVLSEARDVYGTPLARAVHRPSELDKRSLVALHRALAAELAAQGVGELESDLERCLGPDAAWPVDQDASHHMGSTRMGRDPATSVVDPDLRLHGVPNVFLAGASVFPTSGCANPTLTIVALSIRLARHLRERVLAPAAAR